MSQSQQPWGPPGQHQPYQQQAYGHQPYGPPPPPDLQTSTTVLVARVFLAVMVAIVAFVGVIAWRAYTKDPEESGSPVHQASFQSVGLPWPLTVADGRVDCESAAGGSGQRALFVTPDGTTYALNGNAKDKYPPIDPLWSVDPVTELRVPLDLLINAALREC